MDGPSSAPSLVAPQSTPRSFCYFTGIKWGKYGNSEYHLLADSFEILELNETLENLANFQKSWKIWASSQERMWSLRSPWWELPWDIWVCCWVFRLSSSLSSIYCSSSPSFDVDPECSFLVLVCHPVYYLFQFGENVSDIFKSQRFGSFSSFARFSVEKYLFAQIWGKFQYVGWIMMEVAMLRRSYIHMLTVINILV